MKQYINAGTLYFLLWCVYSMQGMLYATGSVISQGILLILLLWSMYMCYTVNSKYKTLPSFIKAVNAFLIMATVYGVILMLSGQELYITEGGAHDKTSNFTYLKDIYASLLPLYVFYEYTKKGLYNEVNLKFFVLLLLLITIGLFFHTQKVRLEEAISLGSSREEFTLNVGYDFLAIIPLLLLWRAKPILQYLLLIVCLGFIIMCMKRGAILIGAVCAIYFILSVLKAVKGVKKAVIIVLSIICVLVVVNLVEYMLDSSDYFNRRIEQTAAGDASHREDLYLILFDHFISEHNLFRILFGNGANATLIVGDNYAHNDWLEIAINNGLLGIFIYISYYVALLKDCIRMKRLNSVYYIMIFMSFIIMFSQTLFSMSYANLSIAQTMVVGFVLAMGYNQKRNNNEKDNLFYR